MPLFICNIFKCNFKSCPRDSLHFLWKCSDDFIRSNQKQSEVRKAGDQSNCIPKSMENFEAFHWNVYQAYKAFIF